MTSWRVLCIYLCCCIPSALTFTRWSWVVFSTFVSASFEVPFTPPPPPPPHIHTHTHHGPPYVFTPFQYLANLVSALSSTVVDMSFSSVAQLKGLPLAAPNIYTDRCGLDIYGRVGSLSARMCATNNYNRSFNVHAKTCICIWKCICI